MKAILSDIHGNLEALQAVLEDIARHEVEGIYCLGDLVGYGPNPRECLDLARSWKCVLLGNFDQAVQPETPDLNGWGVFAGRSVLWSRRQLDSPTPSQEEASRRWHFLRGLPHRHQEGNLLFVHGSPRNPLHEYVFPEDIYCPTKMEEIFSLIDSYCFVGHTHLAGIFTEDLQYHSAEEVGRTYRLEGRKTLCNVGSVGQPRDHDWRACYVLLDDETIHFRRVEYDVAATVRKIHEIDDLDEFLGDRLLEGR